MHYGIYQCLLVGLAQLCYVAKVHVRNAAICQGKDVPRVGVPMEEPKLHNSQ